MAPSSSSAPAGPGNRRKHIRVPARVPLAAAQDGKELLIEVFNIGEGGAYGRSDAPIPVMTRLAVRFELPVPAEGPAPIELEAVIVRCEPVPGDGLWNLALFFPHPDEQARTRIGSFVRARDAGGPGGEAHDDRFDG